ncbi:MAG: Voltage-gated potassium channel [Actinomycetota bacterium]|jgi:voltage-gated potassium channel
MASPTPSSAAEKPKKIGFWKRITTPTPDEDLTPAQRFYNSISSIPMFVVAMTWLVSTFFTWAPSLRPVYREEGVTLSIITWVIFAIDLTIRFVLDPKKKDFMKRNWPFAIALLFPPLRIILVISAVMRVARDRNALAKVVGLYAIYAVLTVVIFGALFTLMFEINAPGANITTYGNAAWWGFVTVTTVGYGDFTPVTVGGRVVAVFIMFTGAAAVGAVTAAVASRFISSGSSSSSDSSSQESQQSQAPIDPHPSPAIGPAPARDEPRLEDVLDHLREMEDQVRRIADRLTDAPATRGTEGE